MAVPIYKSCHHLIYLLSTWLKATDLTWPVTCHLCFRHDIVGLPWSAHNHMEKTKHQLNLLYPEGSYESKPKVPFLFSRSFLNVQCTHVYGSKHHCDSCKILAVHSWWWLHCGVYPLQAHLQVTRPAWHRHFLLPQSHRNNVVQSFMCLIVCVLPFLLCRQLCTHHYTVHNRTHIMSPVCWTFMIDVLCGKPLIYYYQVVLIPNHNNSD